MAKKKKKKRNKPTSSGSASAKPVATKKLSNESQLQNMEAKLDEIDSKHSDASKRRVSSSTDGQAIRDDLAVGGMTGGESLDLSRFEDAVKRAATALDVVEAEKKKLAKVQSNLTEEKSKLDEEKSQLVADQSSHNDSVTKLTRRTAELNQREESILKREQDADQGFVRRDEEFLEDLEKKIQEKKTYLDELQEQIFEAKRQADSSIQGLKEQVFEGIEARDAELNQKADALNLREVEIKRRLTEIGNQEALLDDSKTYMNELVANGMESEKHKYVHRITELENTKTFQLEEIKRLQETVAASQKTELYIKGMTKAEVESHVADLEGQVDALKKKLATRLSDADQAELIDLREKKQLLEEENLRQAEDIRSNKDLIQELKLTVLEDQVRQEQVDSYKSQKQLLETAVDELRAEVDGLTRVKNNKPVFPALQSFDEDRDLQISSDLHSIRCMKKFSETIRIQMASSADPRYYSEQDVRSFIGGMAMSRLHVLQGISGTGKTSLPVAICEAANWGHTVIPVQAGWRDRHDLLGNYNSFERKYYESKFLQHLYIASLPRWQQLPYIIVLDEMNLSNPEQYFADLLSVLENPKEDTLDLLTSKPHTAPKLLMDGGRKIRVPENVWFVGTANHDETTKELADKTYDRSFVLELPNQFPEVEPNEKTLLPDRLGVSFDSLEAGFRKAKTEHEDAVSASWDVLTEAVAKHLMEKFDLGWGNRINKLMSSYCAVVIGCGGSSAEALDQFFATKILRKIRGRYETDKADLQDLKEKLAEGFVVIDDNYNPIHCMNIVNQELSRFQRG